MLVRTDSWPPDYQRVVAERAARAFAMRTRPGAVQGAMVYYADKPTEWIEHWVDTFDPRNAGTTKPTRMPFVLFQRQREFIEFLHTCSKAETHGLIEKSRDMGATWLCCAYSVWSFLFVPGANIGWGSRKAASVDQIGNMNSIFEKMRYILRSIPREFWPPGFTEEHISHMRIHAPNGNSITGESGDDVGRGGRTQIYFKDESAHYEHPEMIEASLGDNTRVQIDISSVNGLGNVFHRKRESGVDWCGGDVVRGRTNVFVMDWRDHPDKTSDWYEERRSKASEEGLLHIFAQEVDRNYAASVEGVVIPAEWVKSAVDAHLALKWKEAENDPCYAGLDVADGGGDRNALAIREASVLRNVEQWGERDTGVTTRRALDGVLPYARKRRRVHLQYDSVGVGAGVKSEGNRLKDESVFPQYVSLVSWNAGAAVLYPDKRVIAEDGESVLNKDFYRNLKAQAWWQLRLRFERTHRAVTEGVTYDRDELISLPSNLPLLRTLEKELSQPTMVRDSRMRLVIDKQPEGTRSPNLADAVVMAYWPVDELAYPDHMAWI
jgi:phage terminase large subunit